MSKLKELEKRLQKEPTNLGLRVMVAGAMREAGRHDEAVELYRSVAIAYRDQGRHQQAIAVCRSILEIAPDDVRCRELLAALAAPPPEVVIDAGTPPPPDQLRDKPQTIPPLVQPRARAEDHDRAVRAREDRADLAARAPLAGTTTPTVATPRTTTPPRMAPRAPTAPPALAKAGVTVPLPDRRTPVPRRSSRLDETPLPVPMPYHVADPTTRSLQKLSEVDLLPTPDPDELPVSEGATTRPGGDAEGTVPGVRVQGIANAARRISDALISHGDDDLSLELDTRQRPRIESGELAKIAQPPPTIPIERIDLADVDEDAATPPPSITLNMRARSRPPEDLDDEEDEGIPTLNDEEHDEPTRPRDTPLDLMIRTEAEGPLGSAFFQPLPADRRAVVLTRFHRKWVKKGTTVIRQGEVGHALVIVVRGQLVARIDRRGGVIELGAIGTGDFIGEGSLLARGPAPTQVVAATDCELMLLPPRDFYEVAGAFPALWAELKDVAERRKRELEAHLRRC